ncbi:type I-C CRISPR-associated protein Cas8c/Csd1 [Pelorhabdus rhamnosifermentans]|uniref:type I-C CRISPR-associated protein Cas8c/Csd1 n=1 Tax=Pelorhabdus rhamnosifermentans TaxID=2772457 RepID=UPI001C062B57|nr:type I-C CRISPR-associated protein Cas8c/Csd1 [Pelorhabdus rhamnosifermentans]
MILQALNEHYQRLLEDKESGIAPPGYSIVDISFVLVLSETGDFLDMFKVEQTELVPEHKKRQGINPPPYFLCDKILYSLGIGKNKMEGKKRFEQYRDYNQKLLVQAKCMEAKAVSCFLNSWNPEEWDNNAIILRHQDEFEKPANYNTVYKIDGHNGYIHDQEEIAAIWMEEQIEKEDDATVFGQCLVTGKYTDIARTHEVAIKGAGGQPAGTALVSFQIESFRSYGKTQSYNAPVSKKVAFAYGTALNYLIASKTNRVRLADTTMVFWADKKGGKTEETILSWCFDPVDTESEAKSDERRIDLGAARQAKTILERVKSGLSVGDATFDKDTRCYLLGLAPNAARLSVRFWQVSNFGDLLKKIAQHYKDMDIIGLERLGGIISPWRTLKALAVREDSKNIPPLLGGQFLKSILSGSMYPQTIYDAVLQRCRTGGEHNGVTIIRAAVIKAFLLRKYRIKNQFDKEVLITVSLNESNTNTAYRLGRLFSLLEKAQKDALGNEINATIRDRYFGAASATPGSVFPLLLRLSRHHIAKATYGNVLDRKIQDVMNGLDAFPAHLSMEDQGQFILGYYHQNQANYTKNQTNEEKKG